MDKSTNKGERISGYDASRIVRAFGMGGLNILCGYLAGICALPFGALPFGSALLACAGRSAIFVYAGLVLSSLESSYYISLIGIYTAILLLRVLARLTFDAPSDASQRKMTLGEIGASLFSEHVSYRIVISAIGAFAISFLRLATEGFLYYDLFGLIISVICAPIASILLYPLYTKRGLRRDIGFLFLSTVCVYGAADIKIYGVSIAVFGALTLTLFITDKRGMVYGAIAGLLMGLVYSPLISPMFVFAAVCAGLFMKISPALAAFASFFTCAAWGFYIRGIYALNGLFAGILAACLLYGAGRRLITDREQTRAKPKGTEAAKETKQERSCYMLSEDELGSIKLSGINNRMAAIGESLSAISELLERDKKERAIEEELERICADAFSSACSGCAEYDACNGGDDNRYEAKRLAQILLSKGSVARSDINKGIASYCARLPDILDEINYNGSARLCKSQEEIYHDDGISPDYKAISSLLEESTKEDGEEYTKDDALSRELCSVLSRSGFASLGIIAYGARRRAVYIKGSDLKYLSQNGEAIVRLISKTVPYPLDMSSLAIGLLPNGSGAYLWISEAEALSVSCVKKSLCAKGEESYCGDCISLFRNSDGKFFAVLSDGMGSGQQAAAVSSICVSFLRSMLRAGRMNMSVLNMINRFLRSRSKESRYECSATVDMMELDLYTGHSRFFKCGAEPSYIYRDGTLFKLRSRTMPIGILAETDAKTVGLGLGEGDIVVMISDGVSGGREECPWLFDLLRQNIDSSGMERTAELILKYAKSQGSTDDMSVLIARIGKAKRQH